MRTRQEYIDLIQQHAGYLQQHFGIRSMRMFGSVARDEHRQDSDLDLLVDMPTVYYKYAEAADYLEDLLGCNVDLIRDRKSLRPFFRNQIERDGITLFTM